MVTDSGESPPKQLSPLAFFRKGIKGDALVRNDFLPVGLVEGNFLWWAFARGTPWTPVHPAWALGARLLFCLTPGLERTIRPRALLVSGLWLPDHGLGGSVMLMPGLAPWVPVLGVWARNLHFGQHPGVPVNSLWLCFEK